MLLSNWKLSIPHFHENSYLLVANSCYASEHIQVKTNTTLSIVGVFRIKKVSPLVAGTSLFLMPHCCRHLPTSINIAETSHAVESCLENGPHLLKHQSLTEDTQVDEYSNLVKSFHFENEREMQRRRKIGLANKGKVPWNKGRKHSEETREIISQKTKEALRDPKVKSCKNELIRKYQLLHDIDIRKSILDVRKKMSECPRSLSNQTKARIGTSLRKLWGQRLKWKRSRERFLQFWAESIARAAKTGDGDQLELEWDSYEKLKREIALQQLEWAAQMAKEKELARILAERAAKERKERKKILAWRKWEREEKAKVRGESRAKIRKRSKEEKEELAVNQEFKLKAKLMKIHKQKPMISHISGQHQRKWENLDMMFKRTEQHQDTLADQIHLAKVRRAESMTQESLTVFSS